MFRWARRRFIADGTNTLGGCFFVPDVTRGIVSPFARIDKTLRFLNKWIFENVKEKKRKDGVTSGTAPLFEALGPP